LLRVYVCVFCVRVRECVHAYIFMRLCVCVLHSWSRVDALRLFLYSDMYVSLFGYAYMFVHIYKYIRCTFVINAWYIHGIHLWSIYLDTQIYITNVHTYMICICYTFMIDLLGSYHEDLNFTRMYVSSVYNKYMYQMHIWIYIKYTYIVYQTHICIYIYIWYLSLSLFWLGVGRLLLILKCLKICT